MINGLDEISQKCLDALASGLGPKELTAKYPVSLDQAKRLSRLNKLYNLAEPHLTPELFMKLKTLGQKVLMWSKVFKNQDWESLAELITATDTDTKRDTYQYMVQAVAEKRQRVEDIANNYQMLLDQLQQKEDEINKAKKEHQEYLTQVKKFINEIENYPEEVKKVLMEILARLKDDKIEVGFKDYNVKYCLARRLIEDWQKELKRKGIIYYDHYNYIWYVLNFEKFVTQVEERLKNKRKKFYHEDGGYYRYHGSRINTKLRDSLDKVNDKIKQLESERRQIKRQLNQAKKKDPKSFLENVLVSNQLSAKDIETHGRLQVQGLKWLFNKEFAAVAELVHEHYRFDAIGFDRNGKIIIIEAKASYEDFSRDIKWQEYLKYCDELYFMIPDRIRYYGVFGELNKKGAGLLSLSKGGKLKEVYGAPLSFKGKMPQDLRQELMFKISRLASRWATYGFTPTKISHTVADI